MGVPRTGKKVQPKGAEDLDIDIADDGIDQSDDDDFRLSNAGLGGSITVKTPAGSEVPLLSQEEADFYVSIAERYQEDNLFKNVSDLLELDRILIMEVMLFRWGKWLLQEEDYHGNMVNTTELQKQIREYSKAIVETKTSLGIDKKSRDLSQGATAAERINNLLIRAKEFGYHRDEQNYLAFNNWMELRGKITLHENSTPTERTEFDAHAKDIMEWIKEKCKELDELDAAFRKNQRIWLRTELND